MNWWTNFGCKLTGWSSVVLSQSSEASKCQLNKYTSAMLILILIWGVTGFCFAQRYVGLPLWACCLASLLFITIVVMVERQIILTSEKTFKIIAFRVMIALTMAVIGSTIIDQTMFGKDIDKQMAVNIEEEVKLITSQRVGVIDEKLNTLHWEIDSIDKVNAQLQSDINAHPLLEQKMITNSQQKILMPDGHIKTVNNPSITTTQIINPKQATLESNNETLADLRKQEQEWTLKKQNVEDEVRKECEDNVGLLQELEAMWTIITTHRIAGAFYLVFFLLLMSLELFVVVSKVLDKECDYEVAIKRGRDVRVCQLANAFSKYYVQSA